MIARVAGWLESYGDPDRFAHRLERLQRTRARIEEVEAAALHFWLLPARGDLRAVRRRVHRLRREVRALENEVGQLEAIIGGDDS